MIQLQVIPKIMQRMKQIFNINDQTDWAKVF